MEEKNLGLITIEKDGSISIKEDGQVEKRGRKSLDPAISRKRLTITLPPFLLALLKSVPNKSRYVEEAIVEKMKRDRV